MKERDIVDRVLDAIAWVCTVITGVAMVVLTVIFGWLVYGRYVLNATPTWVEQVSLLLVVLIAFLGAATGIRHNTHLCVDMFRNAAPTSINWFCKVLGHVVMTGFGLVMAVQSYKLAAFKWSTDIPLIHISEGWRTVPITLCGGLLVLYSMGYLWRLYKGRPDFVLPERS